MNRCIGVLGMPVPRRAYGHATTYEGVSSHHSFAILADSIFLVPMENSQQPNTATRMKRKTHFRVQAAIQISFTCAPSQFLDLVQQVQDSDRQSDLGWR